MSFFKTYFRTFLFTLVFILPVQNAQGGSDDKTSKWEGKSYHGFKIDRIEREASENIAWFRVWVHTELPASATWAVIGKPEKWAGFVDMFSSIKPLNGQDDKWQKYLFTVSMPWPADNLVSVVQMRPLPERRTLLWRVESGSMEANYGKIIVKEEAQGTIILYENYGPAKKRFPGWLVKISIYLVMPSMLKDFYNQVLALQSSVKGAPHKRP